MCTATPPGVSQAYGQTSPTRIRHRRFGAVPPDAPAASRSPALPGPGRPATAAGACASPAGCARMAVASASATAWVAAAIRSARLPSGGGTISGMIVRHVVAVPEEVDGQERGAGVDCQGRWAGREARGLAEERARRCPWPRGPGRPAGRPARPPSTCLRSWSKTPASPSPWMRHPEGLAELHERTRTARRLELLGDGVRPGETCLETSGARVVPVAHVRQRGHRRPGRRRAASVSRCSVGDLEGAQIWSGVPAGEPEGVAPVAHVGAHARSREASRSSSGSTGPSTLGEVRLQPADRRAAAPPLQVGDPLEDARRRRASGMCRTACQPPA